MGKEIGIWNDEGMIDSGFYTQADAASALTEWAAKGETGLQALVICPDHDGEPDFCCEECSAL